MFKKAIFFAVIFIFATQIGGFSKKTDKLKSEKHKGDRGLSYKKRMTADGRYFKLLKRLKVPQDAKDIINQLLYVENGYLDNGYLPEQENYYRYKKVPAGFWVYVYPYWYIWGDQKLF